MDRISSWFCPVVPPLTHPNTSLDGIYPPIQPWGSLPFVASTTGSWLPCHTITDDQAITGQHRQDRQSYLLLVRAYMVRLVCLRTNFPSFHLRSV